MIHILHKIFIGTDQRDDFSSASEITLSDMGKTGNHINTKNHEYNSRVVLHVYNLSSSILNKNFIYYIIIIGTFLLDPLQHNMYNFQQWLNTRLTVIS